MVDSVASWANAITVSRLLLSPVMFWAIPNDDRGSYLAFFLWFLLCGSDFIDGYIARKRGPTSVGAFLDPLADKVLVLGAMFTLVSVGVYPWVPVVVIAARELVISVYRVVLGGKGVSVPAIRLAKYKTVVQQFAVAFALLPAHRGRRDVAVDRPALDLGRVDPGQRVPVPAPRAVRAAHRAAGARGLVNAGIA